MNHYELPVRRPYWRTFSTLLWSVAIFGVFGIAQVFGMIAYLTKSLGRTINESDLMAMMPTLETDGNVLTWASLASFIFAVPLILLIIKLKRGSSIRDYLALNNTSLKNYIVWTLIMFIAVMLMGWGGTAIGEKSATEFTGSVFKSADNKMLLYLAVAVAAPIFEELLFRGFMYKGLAEGPLKPVGAIILTSALWAVIHIQYSWYPIVMIFVMGLILGWSRWKTNSIYVPILLHCLNNFVSLLAIDRGWT